MEPQTHSFFQLILGFELIVFSYFPHDAIEFIQMWIRLNLLVLSSQSMREF